MSHVSEGECGDINNPFFILCLFCIVYGQTAVYRLNTTVGKLNVCANKHDDLWDILEFSWTKPWSHAWFTKWRTHSKPNWYAEKFSFMLGKFLLESAWRNFSTQESHLQLSESAYLQSWYKIAHLVFSEARLIYTWSAVRVLAGILR